MIGETIPEAAPEVPRTPAPDPVPEDSAQPVPDPEFGGRDGPDPTRYGDWEKNGRCIDF